MTMTERIVETTHVGGARPGRVEWLDDHYAIVHCDHDHPIDVYEAACYQGADLDDIAAVPVPLRPGVYRVGPAEED